MDTDTRRFRLELNTPAELAIRKAMVEVEKLPPSRMQTDAMEKLTSAFSYVADFIDSLDFPAQATNSMEDLEDLSWSNIVKMVQHEDIKGADLLNAFALELEQVRKEYFDFTVKVENLSQREHRLLIASQHVVKHLSKQLPLIVQRQGYIVVLTEDNLTVDRNVI
jgi:hypothetical protein